MTRHEPGEADRLARLFADIAIEAGRIVMDIYRGPFAVEEKRDGSPVTRADALAEGNVVAALRRLLPGVQIVAEEACATRLETHAAHEFLLVDALDGTAEFVARRADFTVNIALVSGGVPIAGCVHAPASGEIYIGGETAQAANVEAGSGPPDWHPIAARPREVPLVAVISRSHLDEETRLYLEARNIFKVVKVGSSIKFCRIAEGAADVYPRFGRTMEWDIAAGHAILAAAGGTLAAPDGSPLRYGKAETGFANGAFIAWGR